MIFAEKVMVFEKAFSNRNEYGYFGAPAIEAKRLIAAQPHQSAYPSASRSNWLLVDQEAPAKVAYS
jgi:hypothetical protein